MKTKFKFILFITISMLGALYSCDSMNSNYFDYIKEGPISYAASPDSLKLHPGRNRLMLSWIITADPKVNRAIVYWNNRTDSVLVNIPRTGGIDSVKVLLNDLTEGSYVFEIFTFDKQGNKSVKKEIVGNVYGESYQNTLLIRPVNIASTTEDNVGKIEWGEVSYKEGVLSELSYTDLSGNNITLEIPSDVYTTYLENVNSTTTFTYRTKYFPSTIAIDSFYTEFNTIKFKGEYFAVPKTGWTITASSEDTGVNKRLAVNLIDNNLSNLFVNLIVAGNNYPHWVIVDMKQQIQDVEAFAFYQRGTNPLKTLEILISNDGVLWESLGDFLLPNTPTVNTNNIAAAKPVYAELSRPRSFRYFRHIYKNDYGNSVNVNIHEVEVMKR